MTIQLIELWETYLLQLDSDEDGPPLMPAGVQAEADQKSQSRKAPLEAEGAPEAAGAEDDAERAPSLSGTTNVDAEAEESVRGSDEIVRAGVREE